MARLLDRLTSSRGDTERAKAAELYLTAGAEPEKLLTDFQTFVANGFKGSGPIYSLIAIRALAFAEARFAWRDLTTKKIFTDQGLEPLQKPHQNGTTATLAAQAEVDVSLAGNFYGRAIYDDRRNPIGIRRLRPDWVEIVKARNLETGLMDLLGYVYWPGGKNASKGGRPISLNVDDVVHYIDLPDPIADFRGESWITSAAPDVDADTYMTRHRAKFFTNAATPNLAIVTEQELTPTQRTRLEGAFEARYEGWENAYRSILLEGGADVKVVGANFRQIGFAATQGAGENRLASNAGVPPVIVGFLQGSPAGLYANYGEAVRRFADFTISPKWNAFAAALDTLPLTRPAGAVELVVDTREIAFLQQDGKDRAEIQSSKARTIRTLVDGGYTPESAVDAVEGNDFSLLVHTGLYSVQLQPPGSEDPEPEPDPVDDDAGDAEGDTDDE